MQVVGRPRVRVCTSTLHGGLVHKSSIRGPLEGSVNATVMLHAMADVFRGEDRYKAVVVKEEVDYSAAERAMRVAVERAGASKQAAGAADHHTIRARSAMKC